ncbi:hypothetical protein F5Y12DRAFT_711472 [Xylaria sp. FL1777]|nr:hypothetical protein F5Y12DRAFT_711472 [Xylaria sp. FL1777]
MSFANYFKNNFGQLTVTGTSTTVDIVQDTVDALLNAVSNEGAVLSAVVVDALFDALSAVANTVIGLLDTTIYIPIISDILELIGVPSISFFDPFAWIAAVGFTVVYKIANGDAPFPDSSDVNALKSASTWEDLTGLFGQSADGTSAPKSEAITTPRELARIVHIAGHAGAGFTTLIGCFLSGFEAEALSGDNPFSLPVAILDGVAAALSGAAIFLVPSAPIENTVGKLATAGSGFSSLAVNDGRATKAIIDSILVIPELFVTGWHFYELGQKPASTGQAAAILGEVANLTSDASRISYAIAVNIQEPLTKQRAIVVMLACRVITTGLHTAEAFLVD